MSARCPDGFRLNTIGAVFRGMVGRLAGVRGGWVFWTERLLIKFYCHGPGGEGQDLFGEDRQRGGVTNHDLLASLILREVRREAVLALAKIVISLLGRRREESKQPASYLHYGCA